MAPSPPNSSALPAAGGRIDISVKGGASVDQLSAHIRSVLGSKPIQACTLSHAKGGRVNGHVVIKALPKYSRQVVSEYAKILRKSELNKTPVHASVDGTFVSTSAGAEQKSNSVPVPEPVAARHDTQRKNPLSRKHVNKTALNFLQWLRLKQYKTQLPGVVDMDMVDCEVFSTLFDSFFNTHNLRLYKEMNRRQFRRLEYLVTLNLRENKLCKAQRVQGNLIYSFARADGAFASMAEIRELNTKNRNDIEQQMQANQSGIEVSLNATRDEDCEIIPPNQTISLRYFVNLQSGVAKPPVELRRASLQGKSRRCFSVVTVCPRLMNARATSEIKLTFCSSETALRRAVVVMEFRDRSGTEIVIYRQLCLRTGDSLFYDILKPKTPFQRKHRIPEKQYDAACVVGPPKSKGKRQKPIFDCLDSFAAPAIVKELIMNGKLQTRLMSPTYDTSSEEFGATYSDFWQNMLWANELQAMEDIKTFDIENAKLERSGQFFQLHVAGLAEGRPSVLRGDLVICSWNGKQYKGRVAKTQLLDVLLEFHESFHRRFDDRVDRVEIVRFTFSNIPFRLCHSAVRRASKELGRCILYPNQDHLDDILKSGERSRLIPKRFIWKTTRSLNKEQEDAVARIAKGALRPLPYVIFGPPGTGKTTTVTETVCQLAHLGSGGSSMNPNAKQRILLVAPSNDVTDVLAERLSDFFKPLEMIRVLAQSRSIEQVPSKARRYVLQGMEPAELAKKIQTAQIVVTTVNMAAKFWCMGVQNGHFDILVVDEAGHATEPEVLSVAATMVDFRRAENPGQLVLAGDPMQLGPVITSKLCKKMGMAQSFMERLVKTSSIYQIDPSSGTYPPDLVTLLVQNYRSHQSIIKLPNEMFYHNKLQCQGDLFSTHSMINWEHLPEKNDRFPIVFHAVDGENIREGNSPSWFNPQEAMEVANYVDLLVNGTKPAMKLAEIGIISPYVRQVQKIRLCLQKRNLGEVQVGSVETFQGQERRCIIISTVRSKSEYLDHDRKFNLGFVANEKRFNVAITRAKALLIVIGNPEVLATDEKTWLPFLRYCRDNQSWKGEDWAETVSEHDAEGDTSGNSCQGDETKEDAFSAVTEIVQLEAVAFLNREE